MSACDLNGTGVLVTRPAEHAQFLVAAIKQMGGKPTLFPGVQIEAVQAQEMASRLAPLTGIDLVIFVSPTAVRLGVPLLMDRFSSLDHLRFAAVGQSTAAELNKYGLTEVIVPDGASGGESLASCPQMHRVAGRSVLVVRGEGGNNTLETILRGRGASVSFLECYRRSLPVSDFGAVEKLLREGRIGAWMATSGEILDNLLRLAGKKAALLRQTPLFVNHPHVASRAFSQAVEVIFVTKGGDAGMSAGLGAWFCRSRATMP
ncbi:MAG TPA: uroporphyrinogen-III synthase [Burkholderiales bacterium]|nr:uroporphyrinogen-III synthase [Burkholderiales bacterium]